MKILALLILSITANDSFLLKQGAVEVSVAQVDSLILNIPENQLLDVIYKNSTLEKNIYTLLNMNRVYHYIQSNELLDDEPFVDVKIDKVMNIDTFDKLAVNLNYQSDDLEKNYKDFLMRKELFSAFLKYARNTVSEENIRELAQDYYLVNKKDYLVPEKRKISLIQIDDNSEKVDSIESLLEKLINTSDVQLFEQYAVKYSDDPSVKYNSGLLGEFRSSDLDYAFANELFSIKTTGIVNKVFRDKSSTYIVRIDEITASYYQTFDDVSEKIIDSMRERQTNRYVQSVINSSTDEIEVNKQLASQIFSRYDFLKPESSDN